MRFIPPRVHGLIDYISGVVMIVSPFVFRFADNGFAQWTMMLLGTGVLIVSLFTDYELSLARLIPMPVHLGLDMAAGLFLIAAPWLFGFSDRVIWPYLLFGGMSLIVPLLTRTTPNRNEVRLWSNYS